MSLSASHDCWGHDSFDLGGLAEIEFTAKILSKDGKIVGAKTIRAEAPAQTMDAAAATDALDAAFAKAASDLVAWTAPLVFANAPAAKGKPTQGDPDNP
jgi:phospholipid/cholesterol/gamma-HCH transport system substrate-binding protein